MFEKFTEKARRTIFFGRHEASQFTSGFIETEHLLLGLMQEDADFRKHLPAGAGESIRQQVAEAHAGKKKIPTSVDMPLSVDSKHALKYAADESEALGHRHIDTGHLILGLLRVEKCMAAQILRQNGIEASQFREVVRQSIKAREASSEAETGPQPVKREVVAASMDPAVTKLAELVVRCSAIMDGWDEKEAARRLKRQPWSRKEALGHLVDWAATHQRWIARALTEPTMAARFYPQTEWVSAQHYAEFPWQDLVDLWVCLNRLLVHIISHIPEGKLSTPCKIGLDQPVPLSVLIELYVEHCEDEMGQITTHG